MFDWNDQELVNIIWGEADESDDHIVPYPDGSEERPAHLFGHHIKKEWNEEASHVKPTETKISVAKSELSRGNVQQNSQDAAYGLPAAGLGVGSSVDLSMSNAAKSDRDSMAEKPAELSDCSETFQYQNEDKDGTDLVDYDWANIGSFDDLDRIFSNNEPVFGHISLGNADELWSSSKDTTNRQDKAVFLSVGSPGLECTALNNTSKHSGSSEYMLDEDKSPTPGYEKVNDLTYDVSGRVQTNIDHLGNAATTNKIFMKDKLSQSTTEMGTNCPPLNSNLAAGTVATHVDKMSRKKKSLKSRKKSEDKNQGSTWSSSANQFPQLDSRYMQIGQTSTSLGFSQQMQIQGLESLQYNHFPSPLLAPPLHVNIGSPNPSMSVLPWHQSREGSHKVPSVSDVSGGNSNPLSTYPEIPVSPQAMTPQEKIEKLRRRQQMRAMLAIQQQQQQFTHQTPRTEDSDSQRYSGDDQMQLAEGRYFGLGDCPTTLPFPDPNSPATLDDSSTICMATDNCTLEEAILFRLQDIVAKMDIKLRLCIRDSLLRLAQSAMQRKYAKDTSSTITIANDDLQYLATEEADDNKSVKMTEVETDTNPIDRTVAHLLFHRPLEFSGKLPEAPDSPASAKLPGERKASSSLSTPSGVRLENSETKETQSQLVSKSSLYSEREKSRSSSCFNSAENASRNCEGNHGATKCEPS